MVTSTREREKEMQKQDLIELIKKFAALPENQHTGMMSGYAEGDVIWDFVASDVCSLEIFKSSYYTILDLDRVMAEVAAEMDLTDVEELRRLIEKQQSKVDKLQKELSANRKKLWSIKRES